MLQMMLPTAVADPAQRLGGGMSTPTGADNRAGRPSSFLGRGLRIAVLVALVAGMQQFGDWVGIQLQGVSPHQNAMFDVAVLLLVLAYTCTMALPFVPGIEIGLAVMLVFGPDVYPVVYACTQVALLLSFVAGRLVPLNQLATQAGWLGLHRMQSTLARMEPLEPEKRLEFMLRCAPRCWVRRLIEHRYLALAVLINMPGNAIVGGAGGIGLVAGMSRVFALPKYLLVMALATMPVPVALWICYGT